MVLELSSQGITGWYLDWDLICMSYFHAISIQGHDTPATREMVEIFSIGADNMVSRLILDPLAPGESLATVAEAQGGRQMPSHQLVTLLVTTPSETKPE